jgi:transcriptional regulator with XRE-family HTH domain
MPEEVESIRQARGFQTQGQLAAKFGVSEGTISDIWHGRTHAGESKIPHWKLEEVDLLRKSAAAGMNFTQIGKLIGRPPHAVQSKAYRMRIFSGQPVRKIYDPSRGPEPSNGERA